MYEVEDENLEKTALRDSKEETGLDISKVNILGPIDTVVSRFNISVTPYVGIVPNNIELNNNSDEIEACFKVPLSFLLQDKRHRNDEIKRNGDILEGIETNKGFIKTKKVGVAAAGHSSVLANMAGLKLPLESKPLQALVSEPVKPIIDTVVMSNAVHAYVSQSDKGELVIGAGTCLLYTSPSPRD